MATEHIYRIDGVDCAVCAARIEDAIQTIDGVESSEIDLVQNRLRVRTHKQADDATFNESIISTVRKEEPGSQISHINEAVPGKRSFNIVEPLRVVTAIIITVLAHSASHPSLALLLFITGYATVGIDIVWKALRNLVKGSVFDENFLMTIATIGAFAIGEYAEAVAVMAFYQVGEYVQGLAVEKSRNSIAKLMDIKPVSATVVRNEREIKVSPEEIAIDDILLIRPGEKIPVDAQVISGNSTLDTRALTGESMPWEVGPETGILSGSVNGSGVLYAKAVKRYEDSTVATILDLVEASSRRKAKTERFITRFARYYTPAVVGIAVLLALIPPLVTNGAFSVWLYRALVFLVISCPCALVISVPVGFFGGIGGLARMGILVKGGNYVQTLAKTSHVVFDKTGTITSGTFGVQQVHLSREYDNDEAELITLAASIEAKSNHPIAKAITAYALSHGYTLREAHAIGEVPGKGMYGQVDGISIVIGTDRHMEEQAYTVPRDLQSRNGGSILVSIDGVVAGRIVITDSIRDEAKVAIADLKNLGVSYIGLLSGDRQNVVDRTVEQIGVDQGFGDLLPHQKVEHIERLIEKKCSRGTLLFVGDGINDAPVLARADIGVSMGSIGSDAAVEASDMVVMTDNLQRIPDGIRHARRTVTIITQNIVLALGVKFVVMLLGTVVIATMWLAVFADTGVALLAILNSLRALRYRS
ncbi:MAG TPA: heavy metal translocating P-type ATPase [Sphaerochaetaceae bacterium]|nr:heavy metal translocating P-type ATPase [Sphaerochaetaceae bacterium]